MQILVWPKNALFAPILAVFRQVAFFARTSSDVRTAKQKGAYNHIEKVFINISSKRLSETTPILSELVRNCPLFVRTFRSNIRHGLDRFLIASDRFGQKRPQNRGLSETKNSKNRTSIVLKALFGFCPSLSERPNFFCMVLGRFRHFQKGFFWPSLICTTKPPVLLCQ